MERINDDGLKLKVACYEKCSEPNDRFLRTWMSACYFYFSLLLLKLN